MNVQARYDVFLTVCCAKINALILVELNVIYNKSEHLSPLNFCTVTVAMVQGKVSHNSPNSDLNYQHVIHYLNKLHSRPCFLNIYYFVLFNGLL